MGLGEECGNQGGHGDKDVHVDFFSQLHELTKNNNNKGYWGGGVDVTMGRLQMLFGLSAVGTFIGAMQ